MKFRQKLQNKMIEDCVL